MMTVRVDKNIHDRHYFDCRVKPTNLSLNSDLLAEAKRLNINLSATLEKALIEESLRRHTYCVDEVAAELGMAKRTLYYRMKQLDIQ